MVRSNILVIFRRLSIEFLRLGSSPRSTPMHPIFKVRKGALVTSYLCSGGLIRGACRNILKFNYNLYSSSLDVYQKRCVLYKLLISLRCMNESPTSTACVSTGSRRCVYKSFSLSRFKLLVFT